jgi:hypothetical protein
MSFSLRRMIGHDSECGEVKVWLRMVYHPVDTCGFPSAKTVLSETPFGN